MPIQNAFPIHTQPVSINMNVPSPKPQEIDKQEGFGELLRNAISEVNDAQLRSDRATDKLARGGDIDLHDVMIASQKASITLQTALQVRNKAVEAYQEIMRMQV